MVEVIEGMGLSNLIFYRADCDLLLGNVVVACKSPWSVGEFWEDNVMINECVTFQIPAEEEVPPYSCFEIL